MDYEFDPDKSERNYNDDSRQFGFEKAQGFDWDSSVTIKDERQDYGEARYISYGMIADRLYVMVWTPRGGTVRIISLRKANIRERTHYEKTKK